MAGYFSITFTGNLNAFFISYFLSALKTCPKLYCFSLWTWPLPCDQCLTNHLGTGQWLIQMKEQSPSHSVSGGERIFHRATLFVFPLLSLALFSHCPGKGRVCSCAQQSNSCAMGTCAPGAQWVWLPSKKRQPSPAAAHPGYSFDGHIKHPPGRAHNDSLVLKPIPNAGFPATGAPWPATPPHSHPQKLASPRSQGQGPSQWVC